MVDLTGSQMKARCCTSLTPMRRSAIHDVHRPKVLPTVHMIFSLKHEFRHLYLCGGGVEPNTTPEHLITTGASLLLVLELAVITYHCQFVSLGFRKFGRSYSPGTKGTYHYQLKSPPDSDMSLPKQATNKCHITAG